MSRFHKKSRSQRSRKIAGIPVRAVPLVIFGAVVVMILLGAVLIGPALGNSVDPNFTPKVTNAPALEVAQAFFDLGDQHFNVPVTVVYNLQNVGDIPLRILRVPRVQVLEGC